MRDCCFKVSCSSSDTSVSIQPFSQDGDISIYHIHAEMPEKKSPNEIKIEWEEDMIDILYAWHPSCGTDHGVRQWFAPTVNRSRFNFGAPILCTIGSGGTNRFTVSLSDPINLSELLFYVKDLDQKNKVGFELKLFTMKSDPIKEYDAYLRIDRRNIKWYASVEEISAWWDSLGWKIPSPPPSAKDPLYSSWYNFHQAPDGVKLAEELKTASDIGFKTVILDDG